MANDGDRTGDGRSALNEAERAVRDERIWQLRLQHKSIRTIAAAVDLSHSTVWEIIRKRIEDAVAPLVHEVVAEETARLEYLFEKLVPGIDGGDVPAIESGRKISESMRLLYGANGAVQVNHTHTPGAEAFDGLLQAAKARAAAEKAKIDAVSG